MYQTPAEGQGNRNPSMGIFFLVVVLRVCKKSIFVTLGRLISLFCFLFFSSPLTSAFSKVRSKCKKLLCEVVLCQIFQAAPIVTKSSCENLNQAKHRLHAETKAMSRG